MSTALSAHPPRAAVRAADLVISWLWLVTGMVAIMVVIGGATRLTGSGLSITEWRPVTGALPPLNDAAWLAEFEKYRQTSQYALLNKGMSLADFQFIYWWEWGHRQFGRAIGLVYAGGLFLLAVTRRVEWRAGLVLFGMGLLLGLQGLVGWIMVASGLQPGMVAVAPIKLMLHLTFACLFFASLIGMLAYRGALGPADDSVSRHDRIARWVLLVLVFVQIALGGLVAGSRAGLTFNTWPLMDGHVIPPLATLFAGTPLWENAVDNPALVQFNHRMGAYLLLALAGLHAYRMRRAKAGSGAARRAAWLFLAIVAQAVLGIVTLLLAVPLWAGLAHQGFALVVLGIAVAHVALGTMSRRAAVLAKPA